MASNKEAWELAFRLNRLASGLKEFFAVPSKYKDNEEVHTLHKYKPVSEQISPVEISIKEAKELLSEKLNEVSEEAGQTITKKLSHKSERWEIHWQEGQRWRKVNRKSEEAAMKMAAKVNADTLVKVTEETYKLTLVSPIN